MPIKCLVNFCNNRGKIPGIRYYRLLPNRRRSWLQALGRKVTDELSSSNRICSEHFRKEDILETGKLRDTAVPSLKLKPEKPSFRSFSSTRFSDIPASSQQPIGKDLGVIPITKKYREPSSSDFAISTIYNSTVLPGILCRKKSSETATNSNISRVPIAVDHNYSKLSLPKFPVAKAATISEVTDIKNVCRACLSTQNLNNMKLTKYQDSTFIHLFETLRNKKVSDDGLSQNLCNSCVDFLLKFKHFMNKCDKAEEMLKKVANVASMGNPKDSNSPVVIDLCDDEAADELICERQSNNADPVTQFSSTKVTTGVEKTSVIPNTSHVVSPADTQMKHSRLVDDVISFLVNEPKYDEIEPAEEVTEWDQEDTIEVNPTRRLVFPCLCGQNYFSFYELRKHKRESQHRDYTTYKCDYCQKPCRSKYHYIIHKRSHTKERPYICHLCGERFTFSGSLHRHEKNHSGVKEFICCACGQAFTTNSMLMYHERSVHRREKPHLCNYCGDKFAGLANLVLHIRNRHQGLKPSRLPANPGFLNRENIVGSDTPTPFQCQKCHKYVVSAGKLKRHMYIHYEVVCLECSRRFASERDLKIHSRVHDGDTGREERRRMNLTCRYCEKEFRTKQKRVLHENVHTGTKPYKCPICGKSFTQQVHLWRHMLLHTGERPQNVKRNVRSELCSTSAQPLFGICDTTEPW